MGRKRLAPVTVPWWGGHCTVKVGGGRPSCQDRDRWANRRPRCSPLLLHFPLCSLHLHRARPPGRPLGVCTQSASFPCSAHLTFSLPVQAPPGGRPLSHRPTSLNSHSSRQPASGTFLFLLNPSADLLRIPYPTSSPACIVYPHRPLRSTVDNHYLTFDSARGDKRCLCHWLTP